MKFLGVISKKNRKLKKIVLPDLEKIAYNNTETKIVSGGSVIQKNSAEENNIVASKEELGKQWSMEISSKYQPETAQIENFKSKTKKFATKKEELTDVSKAASKAKYKNVDPEVDFEYTFSGYTLKENIILNKKLDLSEKYSFDFEFKTDLKVEKDINGNLNFKDQNGKTVYVMPKVSMWDSSKISAFSTDVEYDFKETDGGYLISIVPNQEWLDSSDRVYPITIDLSINKSIITGIEDTRNVNVAPDNNYSYGTSLIVGRTPYSNQQEYWKSYIKCKNSPNLSHGEIVTKSELKLKPCYSHAPSNNFSVKKISNSWNSTTLTWNNQPKTNAENIDYVKILSSSMDTWYSCDITYY